MAGAAHQKQLLTLIRDFATEKSQGERRVASLRKQLEELRSELDVANENLEEAKRHRETAEQEAKSYEVELALNESTVQSLQGRISTIHDQISAVKSDIADLKNKEASSRDEFIKKMFEINDNIRKLMLTMANDFSEEDPKEDSIGESEDQLRKEEIEAIPGISLDDKLDYIVSQMKIEEEMLRAEQDLMKQLREECTHLEKNVSLMEAITNETRDLHELTRQNSELEQKCGQLVEELQRKSICTHCHQDNVDALKDILQSNEEDLSILSPTLPSIGHYSPQEVSDSLHSAEEEMLCASQDLNKKLKDDLYTEQVPKE